MKANNILVTVIVVILLVGVYFARKSHSEHVEGVQNVIKLNSQKDTTISILISKIDVLTHDTTQYRLRISVLDSTVRFYSDKNHYLELLLNSKDKLIKSINKNDDYYKVLCSKRVDSLTRYINSFERVHVPN